MKENFENPSIWLKNFLVGLILLISIYAKNYSIELKIFILFKLVVKNIVTFDSFSQFLLKFKFKNPKYFKVFRSNLSKKIAQYFLYFTQKYIINWTNPGKMRELWVEETSEKFKSLQREVGKICQNKLLSRQSFLSEKNSFHWKFILVVLMSTLELLDKTIKIFFKTTEIQKYITIWHW